MDTHPPGSKRKLAWEESGSPYDQPEQKRPFCEIPHPESSQESCGNAGTSRGLGLQITPNDAFTSPLESYWPPRSSAAVSNWGQATNNADINTWLPGGHTAWNGFATVQSLPSGVVPDPLPAFDYRQGNDMDLLGWVENHPESTNFTDSWDVSKFVDEGAFLNNVLGDDFSFDLKNLPDLATTFLSSDISSQPLHDTCFGVVRGVLVPNCLHINV